MKILLTLACVFGMNMTASAEQSASVLLEHEGKITTFEPEKIGDAITAAKDGDVITLTAGDFPGFTIDKQISVKGSGAQTVIKGDIKINNAEKTLNNIFIGYMSTAINSEIIINSPVKGFKISQCKLLSSIIFYAITEDSYIDRCYINSSNRGLDIGGTYTETVSGDGYTSVYRYSYVKGLTVTNSVILMVTGNWSEYIGVSFANCYIWSYNQFALCGAKIVNSILHKYHNIELYRVEMINTSHKDVTIDSDCSLSNCYDVTIEDYMSEDIKANGYLGNDGTIIGPLGGNTPYTLIPTVPHVTEANLKVNPKKQELNATLTVSPK